LGENFRTLEELIDTLRHTYCRSIGVQFMHIDDCDVREWLQKRMEGTKNRYELTYDVQKRILTRLTDAVIFEEFMRKKYVGAKTFSLEGGETLIPLLDLAIEASGDQGVKEIVLGMAHRGRLNVLANIMNKRAQNIFWTFDDPNPEENRGRGDVLYHLGHSSDWQTAKGQKVHISLCFNPSHLEFVNPVAVGRCRSKQDRIHDIDRAQVLTILIHGDAAFAGEGVVQETFNLSELDGYETGGTLHVILNNQIGFTTPAELGRSTTYASDVAKMLQIPIFHVNGEDPEAVAQVVQLSMDFRQKFRRDVVIDMYCYRRYGHNESDEPRFTQPLMYQAIDQRPTIRDSFLKRLLKMRQVTNEVADKIAEDRYQILEEEFDSAKVQEFSSDLESLGGYWKGYYGGNERDDDDVDTGAAIGKLTYTLDRLTEMPDGFSLNPKLKMVFRRRKEMSDGKSNVDWATAELAAMGTLALEGRPVRISGQDTGRGTFSQRHAEVHDTENGESYIPLQHLSDDQARVEIINSPLSETAVLGFDYGYSLDHPDGLVAWEAQFGDFYNVAQVIVDQFIASAEDKWRRLSGLVMLLPHGFEGAGPEHCSARMERFLTLTAEHNMQVVNPTTAAQYFHALRRQVLRQWRKPLIVFTPKSLLREPLVSSPLAEFTSGTFQRVLPDPDQKDLAIPQRILLCSGKVAIDLIKARRAKQKNDVAVIRMEQMYPLPQQQLETALGEYADGTPVYWVQEEPKNMGGWAFMRYHFGDNLFDRWPLSPITRPESASPSTGSKKTHKIEQEELITEALGPAVGSTKKIQLKVRTS
jgi:2-oxoglutarate dehydrogenase E1 component